MATAAQMTANYQNAQASTGPKTEAGKAAVAQNSTRHGLSGHTFVLLPHENPAAFDDLLSGLSDEHQPDTPTETFLVLELARAHWRLDRVGAIEAEILGGNGTGDWSAVTARFAGTASTDQTLARLTRYEQAARRAWHQALNQLLKLRSTVEKTEVRVSREYSNQMEALATRVCAERVPEPPPAHERPKYETKPIPVHLQRELDAHKRRDPLFDPSRDRSQLSKELRKFFDKQGLW